MITLDRLVDEMTVLLLYVVVDSYFNVQPCQGSPTGSIWYPPECRVRPPWGPARSRKTHKRLVLCESPAGSRKDIKSKKKMLLTSVRSCCGGLLAASCWQAARMAFAKNTRGNMLALVYICSPADPHMFNLNFLILRKCVHLGRDDISCITSRSLFDLSSFIFFAKKPDIIGSFCAPFWVLSTAANVFTWMLMREAQQQGKYSKCGLSTLRLSINKVYISISHCFPFGTFDDTDLRKWAYWHVSWGGKRHLLNHINTHSTCIKTMGVLCHRCQGEKNLHGLTVREIIHYMYTFM